MTDQIKTPVALVIFRRPDLTAMVLDTVRAVKPPELYVIADGPRADKPGEAEACAAARAVIDTVDWDCRVHRHYSDTNLGCGNRPASGFDWLFDQVDSAIILEDDCIPHHSFFGYCEELLGRYRDDERVMHISGCTYRAEPWGIDDSYFFSRYPACWGWATWARAWKHYEFHCEDWPRLKETAFLEGVIGEPAVEAYWANWFDESNVTDPLLHTWDYQWAFACWANSGLAVCPRHNLVCNVGTGEGATHTTSNHTGTMALPTYEMPLPLRHPKNVLHDIDLDRRYVSELLLPEATGLPTAGRRGVQSTLTKLLPGSVKRRVKQLIR